MIRRSALLAASFALALLAPASSAFAQGTSQGISQTPRPTSQPRPTSVGTSRNQTTGGRNIVKYSVMAGSQIAAAKDINGALGSKPVAVWNQNYRRYDQGSVDIRTALAKGFTIQHHLPGELAEHGTSMQVRPWKEGEAHVLTDHVANSVASRLAGQSAQLRARAERLYTKGEITEADRAHANEYAGKWEVVAKHFSEAAKPLEPGKYARTGLAVELDK